VTSKKELEILLASNLQEIQRLKVESLNSDPPSEDLSLLISERSPLITKNKGFIDSIKSWEYTWCSILLATCQLRLFFILGSIGPQLDQIAFEDGYDEEVQSM